MVSKSVGTAGKLGFVSGGTVGWVVGAVGTVGVVLLEGGTTLLLGGGVILPEEDGVLAKLWSSSGRA